MLRQAIIEQWQERFTEDDPRYADRKIKKVEECNNLNELLYHCMNIDIDGHHLIADKIRMTHRDFAFFLSAFRAMDQGHIFEGGEDGFYYRENIAVKNGKKIYDYVYPDETVIRYESV
ncbi:hypothetical protein ACLHDG_14330 [Sulfurovum sp. CS9]|uniref:hypothetical protein n=1 Tax=Sulfurovum sp. CS9 TaxID=3391146 RepID=UPI0039EB98FC